MPRRDNGLPAEEWLVLADVEAPLTDHVLQTLADEGIAAYAEPSSDGESVYLGSGRSMGPSDRVMVDRDERTRARAVLAALLPELRSELAEHRRRTEADSWEQIVSGLSAEGVGSGRRIGRSADDDADSTNGADDDANPSAADDAASGDDWSDVRPEPRPEPDAVAEDEEHFVPPEPPPLPTTDTVTRTAWIGLVGGPLVLILDSLLGWNLDGVIRAVAAVAFVAGFVTLIARMKDRPHDVDDDGAIV